jgi:hypothetical protein
MKPKVSKLSVKRETVKNLIESELDRANGAMVTCASNKYSGCSTSLNVAKTCAANMYKL